MILVTCSRGRLFKGGSPLRPSVELSTRTQSRKQSLPRVVEPFNEFLKTLRKPAAHDIFTHLKTCVLFCDIDFFIGIT